METNLKFPRLRDEVVFLPVEGGVLIDGCANPVLIGGVLSETLLPILLPKLDGNHSLDDLRSEFSSISEDLLVEAIARLTSRNLLIDNPTPALKDNAPNKAFLFRYDLAFEGKPTHPHAAECLELSAVEISIAGRYADWLLDPLFNDLRSAGIQRVTVSEYSPTFKHFGQIAKLVLSGKRNHHHRVTSPAIMYLGVGCNPSSLRIGPVIESAKDGCTICCDLALDKSVSAKDSYSSSDRKIATSFVLWEICDVLLNAQSALRGSRLREYDLRRVSHETWYFPCHQLNAKTRQFPASADLKKECIFDTSSVYNDRINSEFSHHMIDNVVPTLRASTHVAEFAVSHRVELPRSSRELSLAASRILLLDSGFRMAQINLHSLSALCSFGCGIREQGTSAPRRWVPSAGNLGSIRLHVLSLGLDHLEQGLYAYDATSHSLISRKNRGSSSVTELFKKITGCKNVSDSTLLILTSRQDLLAHKYKEFSYKLSNLDAGVAIAQIGLIGVSMGLSMQLLMRWPDATLTEELNLRKGAESVAIVLNVGARMKQGNIDSMSKNPSFHDLHHSHDFYREISMMQLTEILQNESEYGFGGRRDSKRRKLSQNSVEPKSLIMLPAHARSSVTVAEVLQLRKSVRQYSQSSILMSQIHTVLKSAWVNDREEWRSSHDEGIVLIFTIVYNDYASSTRSVYRYIPEHSALERLHPSIAEGDVRDMFIQDEFAYAPATIIVSCNIAHAVSSLGSGAYRSLLVRAGAAAHRMWLAALGLDLEGTLVAGLRTTAVRMHIEKEHESQSPLLACSLGNRAAHALEAHLE
jgi:SagB-type dehydrogenase family enzyme